MDHLHEGPSIEGESLETKTMPQWERLCPATIIYIRTSRLGANLELPVVRMLLPLVRRVWLRGTKCMLVVVICKCVFASMYVAGVMIKVRIATFDQFQTITIVCRTSPHLRYSCIEISAEYWRYGTRCGYLSSPFLKL